MVNSPDDAHNPLNGSSKLPQPGEIWAVSSVSSNSGGGEPTSMPQLDSMAARSVWVEECSSRYVMIVQEAETQNDRTIVSVMVLSEKTEFLSAIDLLIPSAISGVDRDLLAETWHVFLLCVCDLSHPVGKRLSREIYDRLLDVGDAAWGLLSEMPSWASIESLGLKIGISEGLQPEMQIFHQREQAWSESFNVSRTGKGVDQPTWELVNTIAEAALAMEQEWDNSWQNEAELGDRSDFGDANLTEDPRKWHSL